MQTLRKHCANKPSPISFAAGQDVLTATSCYATQDVLGVEGADATCLAKVPLP